MLDRTDDLANCNRSLRFKSETRCATRGPFSLSVQYTVRVDTSVHEAGDTNLGLQFDSMLPLCRFGSLHPESTGQPP